MKALEHTYRYREDSVLGEGNGKPSLHLATSGGRESNPHFFAGSLLSPRRTADFLLALYEVVQSRFYIPSAMLQRILREADPVVTCDGERLRFEVFSSCCSVYARVDLLPEALSGSMVGRGTTNVDFNPPLRAALARVRDDDPVALRVGREQVELDRAGEKVVERKVRLPTRWIRGFLEIQSYLRGLEAEPRLRVSGSEALRFLRSLPRGKLGTSKLQVSQTQGRLRLARAIPSNQKRSDNPSVPVAGVERLRILEPILHHAQELQVFASSTGMVSCWQLLAKEMRFQLVLSPEVSRGFSGEGQALESLLDGDARRHAKAARALLGWQGRIDETELARQLQVDASAVERILAVLGTEGLVGFDVEQGAYFSRELPFQLSEVEKYQPRLVAARRLVEEGHVQIISSQGADLEAYVQGSGVEHRVRLGVGTDEARCTCRWFAKHQGDRGPCKHILALRLARRRARGRRQHS
ncbi:MAG: SWIM zinc finger domain-containing protein [Deltaproteobacteria bacterium]|nr:SWIM zinc finger domain-containing protein [Deltaproteobacteria bacterium]